MKFSPKCRTKKLGMKYTPFWEVLFIFQFGRGPIIGPKSGLGKSLLNSYTTSVVPRARHCGIPAILPSMSLKNAPSAGLRARPKKSADFRYLNHVSVFSVTQ